MTMFILHLLFSVYQTCFVSIKGDNYFALFFSMYQFFCRKQNSESHVCPLKTASKHVAVKYGMKRKPLLVFMNLS